ncbi:cadherin-like protein 26 [Heterodontus francisci]|uniref:cadherin-like protein 26 n=1 Tax=Heterodontus francisci TaxID=7792 RepID=UPI00355C5014
MPGKIHKDTISPMFITTQMKKTKQHLLIASLWLTLEINLINQGYSHPKSSSKVHLVPQCIMAIIPCTSLVTNSLVLCTTRAAALDKDGAELEMNNMRLTSVLSLVSCFINMGLGTYALVLFLTMELNRVEGQHSVVLHREKRRWISSVFKLTEEDKGPFPKIAMKLSNDRALNYSLIFSISGEGVEKEPEKGLFSIDRHTGEVFINRKVDREKTKKMEFQVDVLEKDSLRILDDHMLYRIVIADINDNAPKFSQHIYKFDVLENTRPGEEIFRVEAVDPDDERLGNGKVSYSIVSQNPTIPSNVFEINPENGSMILRKCLNYEALKSYSLVIKARDNGLNILSSSAEVQINVIDSNNNPPILTQESASAIIGETDNNVVILRLNVTDKDTPNTPAWRAKYKIVEGNEDENFKIETDPETNDGILFLIKSLDYEHGPRRKLKIIVENEEPFFKCAEMKDKGSDVLQEFTAVITVKDRNDPPVFSPPVLTVNEVEGQKPGKILGRFNATDTDKFFKHSIRYVRGFEPAEWITVDSDTGVVTTVKTLDRESAYVNNSVYTFTVFAIDDGEIPTTGTGTMSLFLVDINDNLPYLVNTHQDMCDDGEVQFITVTAQDDDLDPFSGPFTFELLDNEQHIKDEWKLRKATAHTAQLVRQKRIPIGNYIVPFKIRDRQGITQECSLNLHICHCLDGKTCPTSKHRTAVLGGAAIGVLFAGLLLLLLGFCLFLFCAFTKKKAQYSLPLNEPLWTLVEYNEEGGTADNQTAPIFHSSSLVVSTDAGVGAGRKLSHNSNIQKGAQVIYRKKDSLPYGGGTLRLINTSQEHGLNSGTNRHYWETSPQLADLFRSSSHSYRSKAWDSRSYLGSLKYGDSTLRPINTSQEHDSKAWANRHNLELDTDELEVSYKPRVYSYEGEELNVPSLESICIAEDNTGFDYLNDLGPKFATLARICQEKYPQ